MLYPIFTPQQITYYLLITKNEIKLETPKFLFISLLEEISIKPHSHSFFHRKHCQTLVLFLPTGIPKTETEEHF